MKNLTRFLNLIIISSFLIIPVSAKPNEFKTVVKQIKKQYNAKQMRIPMVFGLVGLGARIFTKGAIKGLKIAVFEDQDFSKPLKDNSMESVFANTFDSNWTPNIRSYSKKSGERTYLYSKEAGKDFQLLITSIEERQAVVVTVKVNPEQMQKLIEKYNEDGSVLDVFGIGNKSSRPENPVNAETKSNSESKDATIIADVEIPDTNIKTPEIKAVSDTAEIAPVKPIEGIKADLVIDTKLVNVNAKVLAANGKPITTLTKDDFTLFENNIKQEITNFSPVTAPINLILLLDYSGSTDDKQKLMREAAKQFVDSLGVNDRIAVAVFGRKVKLIQEFTADKKLLKKKIGDIDYDASGTAYYDSMWTTLDQFKNSGNARNAIVVLTDGVDNSISRPKDYPVKHSFNELMERIAEEEITIYPLYLDTEEEQVVRKKGRDTHETYATARQELKAVAEQTSGTYYHVADIKDLTEVYAQVANELRTIYSLAFSSTKETTKKEWRTLKLTVNQEGAQARAKKGYFAR